MDTSVKSEHIKSMANEKPVTIYSISVTGYKDINNLVQECVVDDKFCAGIEKWGIKLLREPPVGTGGFSAVCRCAGGSVIKIASFRKTCPSKTPLPDNLFDWNCVGKDDANKVYLDFLIKRESNIHSVLTDEQKNTLVAPFIIKVSDGIGNIIDYFICVNMPEFIPLKDFIDKDNFDEKLILKMTYDVLNCLNKAHLDGVRHRDVKTKNILYDKTQDKFVLADWGSSGINTDLEILRNALKVNFTMLSECYFNPYIDFATGGMELTVDIYPLGVVMAYLTHPFGYRAGNKIADFHKLVSPNSYIELKNNKYRVITRDVYSGLTDSSEGFKMIVKKAMYDSYNNVSEMLEDVKKLLDIERTSDVNDNVDLNELSGKTVENIVEKKSSVWEKPLNINSLFGFFPVLAIVLFTMLFTKENFLCAVRYETGGEAVSVIIAIFCLVIPILISVFKKSGEKQCVLSVEIRLKTLIEGSVLYLISMLTTNFILSALNEYASLDINCILYLITLFLTWVMTKFRSKDEHMVFLLSRCLIVGSLYGLASGTLISACLSRGKLINIFSKGSIGLICSVILLFIVFSLCVFYFLYKMRTRGVKVSNFK